MASQDSLDTLHDDPGLLMAQDRTGWVRLRTLILLRWVAIVGQIIAITVAQRYYSLTLEIGLCYLAVGVSVIFNLIAIFVFPENKRLTENQNFFMVMFDLLQLGFLLFLTGGLHNPFALLLIGPVTISAAILSVRSYAIMVAAAVSIASLLTVYYFPLRTEQGFILRIPDIFIFGYWIALVIGVVFLGVYTRRITNEMHSMSDALSATQMALAREQKLTDLGGVVAAAAHELGTPLATIKLASAELMEELADFPELQEDAALIREQADRCRDILRDMGRAGKDDKHLRKAPLSALVQEAAEPHEMRGVKISYNIATMDPIEGSQPTVLRKPEIIHGLRNLIQNAVDFAQAEIWIEGEWTSEHIAIRIADDGPGYPPHILGRIGDPFMRSNRRSSTQSSSQRPGYEGMGLGLFIAKTLLERTGAELTFANGRAESQPGGKDRSAFGALVEVSWPRSLLDADTGNFPAALGQNQRISI